MHDVVRNDSIALINGVIFPMAAPGRISALYAEGGIIRALGSDREILAKCVTDTVVLDLRGKFVLPGFTDTHISLLETGRALEMSGAGSGKAAKTSRVAKFSEEDLERWYRLAERQLLKLGVTAVQTDDTKLLGSADAIDKFYRGVSERGDLRLRVTEQYPVVTVKDVADLIDAGYPSRGSAADFGFGPVKLCIDGNLVDRTAFLTEEYSDAAGKRGLSYYTRDELCAVVEQLCSAGIDIVFQATGDAAVMLVLDVVESVMDDSKTVVRLRIEGCRVLSDELLERMSSLNVCVDITPMSIHSDKDIIVPRLGAERARLSDAWMTMLQRKNILLGAGSYSPNYPAAPFDRIRYMCMRRNMSNKPSFGWIPAQRLDRVDAILVCTAGSAAVCGDGAWRGTLDIGMAADIAAFMKNPFLTPDNDIPAILAGLVIVDGKIQYIE